MPAFQYLRLRSSALTRIGGMLALGLAICAQTAPAFDGGSNAMPGDCGGARKALSEQGYDFKIDYTGEMGANLQGGSDHDRTARYSDQWGFGSHLDLENQTMSNDATASPSRWLPGLPKILLLIMSLALLAGASGKVVKK